MIINRQKIDLQDLALQVLKTCPEDASIPFQTGYATFTKCIFLDLEFCTDTLTDEHGQFEVDLSLTIKLTLNTLKSLLHRIPLANQAPHWDGITQGALVTERMLMLAFDENLKFQAA